MIQIKSNYGKWQTADRNKAVEFIKMLIDGGCRKSKIDNVHLQGISCDELLSDEINMQMEISIIEPVALLKEPKPINENLVDIGNCTVQLEDLARKEAFYRFQQNILFSLTIWQLDDEIRHKLPPIADWIKECIEILQGYV